MAQQSYYMVLDPGGTKVAAILYDENFRLISSHRVGSFRKNTTSETLIQRNIKQLIEEMELSGKTIRSLYSVADPQCTFLNILRQTCTIENVINRTEIDFGLYAAEIFGDGALALSGTGSHARLRLGTDICGYGGYGGLISDEGSGFWIGRQAINAALLDDQRRGPTTSLTKAIFDTFAKDSDTKLDEAVFRIYEAKGLSPSTLIASCCRLTFQAADAGDDVATRIIKKGGCLLAEQLVAALNRYCPHKDIPLAVSGSVWRGGALFARSFADTIHAAFPEKSIIFPRFEPIVGPVLKHYYDEHGPITDSARQYFSEEFSNYLFTVSPETVRIPFVNQK